MALHGGVGNEVIKNRGAIAGDILLGTGTNPFDNHASGLFLSGAVVDLGAGNMLTNEGQLAPGGTGPPLRRR